MSDQNALLRLLAAQQMMGLSGASGSSSTSRPSTSSGSTSSSSANNLAAAMAGFGGGMNPQLMMWQNMLLAQQQAQAMAMIQMLSQPQQAQSSQQSRQSGSNSFEEAMKKLAAASQKSTSSATVKRPAGTSHSHNSSAGTGGSATATATVKTGGPLTNGFSLSSLSPTVTPSPSKLEPGELPRKTEPSTPSSSTATSSPTRTLSSTPTTSTGAKSGSNNSNPLAALANQNGMNASSSAVNQVLWHLYAQQMLQQQKQTQKSSKQSSSSRREKENGMSAHHSKGSVFSTTVEVPKPAKEEREDHESTPDNSRKPKHIVTDINAVRKALDFGWRRQTCIRSISSSGLRGDVVYYAPCGKKLSTYAEVIRYLQKTGSGGGAISRDHFSFSCKMIVGEYVMFKVDETTGERGIVKLSEEEVTEEIQKMTKPKPLPKPIVEKVKKERVKKEASPEFDHGEEEIEYEPVKDDDTARGSRVPIDDLLLEEVRPLPELPRVEHLELKGNGFADALMVHEFLNNFHHVLKLAKDSIPQLGVLCSGLAGEKEHLPPMLLITKTLLSLVLEYPGLPRRDKDKVRQQAGELELSRENYSEMIRLFLQSREDKLAQELASHLETAHYEEVTGDVRAGILAFMCNELLYCRNIVREIDSNLEEIGRMRGDRWMRDGKVRALRGVQKRKMKKRGNTGECGERPDSRNSDISDNSRPSSPIKSKVLTPGIGQCEVLTEEEENMSVDELERLISTLNEEADSIKSSVNKLTSKVRTFPLGQDRFHRIFWKLPNVPAVLVESIESAGKCNSAVNVEETCSHDPPGVTEPHTFVHPDVLAVTEELIDDIVFGSKYGKKKRRRVRRMENGFKRGWWTVDRDRVKPLRDSLHGRGIRERALHRLLLRDSFVSEQQWTTLSMEPVVNPVIPEEVSACELARAERAVREIENRVADASLQLPGWRPPFEPFDEMEGYSQENGDSWLEPLPSTLDSIEPEPSVEDLRSRLLDLEEHIERRYLRQNFCEGQTISANKVLGKDKKRRNGEKIENEENEVKEEKPEKENKKENGEKEEKIDVDDDEDKDGDGEEEREAEKELRDTWRAAVASAESPSKIIMCAQVLEQCIAWERSAMKACCQICRQSDQEEKLLLCDLCDLGYHIYCFKPPMDTVPQGEWFCPKCKESASGKPTCVLCSQQTTPIYGCQKCYSYFHSECAGEPTPDYPRQYKCAVCEPNKKVRILERDCDSRAGSETSDDASVSNVTAPPRRAAAVAPLEAVERRAAPKRKAPDAPPVVFPPSMTADLARTMLDELEAQQQAGPFLEPVDPKEVPGYQEVIENPIDLQTMRDKADAGSYEQPEDFHQDVELMFTNCRTFNEDESPIGQAGIQLHKFFAKRWRQVRYNFCKRLKRMRPDDRNALSKVRVG